MRRQIRSGVFETNSSSMHSLTVMKRDDRYTPEEILEDIYLHKDKKTGEENCIWEPWESDMHFGRSPFRVLATFADKWLYALASLVGEYNSDEYKELEHLALKYVPGLKKIILPKTSSSVPDIDDEEGKNNEYFQKYGKSEEQLIEFLKEKEEKWGFEIDYWKSCSGYWHYDSPDTGYVDENILSGFLEKEGITLEEYLINKKYIVVVDGDEYDYYGDMKRSGLINLDIIDHEYPYEEE